MDQIKLTTLGLALAAAFGWSSDAQAQTSGVTFGTTRPIVAQTANAPTPVFKAPQFGPTPVKITTANAIESAQDAPAVASVSYENMSEYEPVILLPADEEAPQTTFAPVAQDVANDVAEKAPSPAPVASEPPKRQYVLSDPFARPRPERPAKGPKEESAMTKALEKGAEDGVFTRNGKHVYSFEPPTTLSALKSKPKASVQSAQQNVRNAVYPTQTQTSRYPSANPQVSQANAAPIVPQVNALPVSPQPVAPPPAAPQPVVQTPIAPQPIAPPAQVPAPQPQIDYALNYSQPSPQTPAPTAESASATPNIVEEYAPMPAQGASARFANDGSTFAQPSASYPATSYPPASYPYVDEPGACYAPCGAACAMTGFFGGGEWLSWQTERSNNAYAVVGDDAREVSPSGTGFRATAGFRGARGWDVSWTYTYFDADKSQAIDGANLDSSVALNGVGPFAGLLADSASGAADVNLQVHDFELGRWNANYNSSLAFRPFIGFRWTQLEETLDRQYADFATVSTDSYYSRSKLEAYGLRLGAETRIPLFGSLSIFGKGAGTIAVGDVKANYVASIDGNPFAAYNVKKTYCTPSVEAALGLSWKRGGFEARGGYEFNDWFNASNVSGKNDDFIAHGWFAGISLNR